MTINVTRPTLGMILKGYPRISETFISNEILLLEQLGIPVRIFSMRLPRESFCHESVKQIQAKVDYLPTDLFLDFRKLFAGTAFYAVNNRSLFLKALAKAGKRFSRTRSMGTLKHLMQGCYVSHFLLAKSPEVVHLHSHFAHSPTSVAMFSSMLSGIPFSFTGHAKDIYTSNREQLQEKIELATQVITCTRFNVEYLRSLAKEESTTPIHCIYHGIDLHLFKQAEAPDPPKEPYNILTVARLTEKKGIPDILQALVLLKQRGIDFTYTLIGDGDDRDQILEQVCASGLREQLRWLGTMPHEKVIEQFKRADVFILGCKITPNGDRDGIPNVLVESLAMGLPAIATNVSALPEIVIADQTGLTVEPDDPAAMADGLQKILADKQQRTQLIEAGKEHVQANFDNKKLILKLASLYKKDIPQLVKA